MVSRFTRAVALSTGRSTSIPLRVCSQPSQSAMERELNGERHAKIETFGDHDVVLIKVKASQWKTPQEVSAKAASYTIRLLTERQRALFGFKFVLMSQEALNAVRAYEVEQQVRSARFSDPTCYPKHARSHPGHHCQGRRSCDRRYATGQWSKGQANLRPQPSAWSPMRFIQPAYSTSTTKP